MVKINTSIRYVTQCLKDRRLTADVSSFGEWIVFHCGQTFFFLSSSVLFLFVLLFPYFLPSFQSPGQTDSQVDASVQNQNLRTDLRRVAKRSRKSQKKRKFHATCAGWPNGKKTSSTCVPIWARPKSTQVDAMQVDRRKWVVENLRRLASPFGQVVSVRDSLYAAPPLVKYLIFPYLYHVSRRQICYGNDLLLVTAVSSPAPHKFPAALVRFPAPESRLSDFPPSIFSAYRLSRVCQISRLQCIPAESRLSDSVWYRLSRDRPSLIPVCEV